MRRRYLALLIGLFIACKHVPRELTTVAEHVVPWDCAEFSNIARDTFYAHAAYVEPIEALLTEDPYRDEGTLRKYVADLGYGIITRPGPTGYATAVPGMILLPQDFNDKSPMDRAALLAHEASHAQWQSDVGVDAAIKLYTSPPGRTGVEVAASALQHRALKRYHATPSKLRGFPAHVASSLHKNYVLDRAVTQECLAQLAAELLGPS